MRIFSVLLTAFFLSFATSASAITVLYDFEQNLSDNQTSVDYIENGVTLTVSSTGGQVHRAGNGIGVRGNPEGARIGLGEQLTFTFDGYRIDSFTATIWERGSEDEQFIFGSDGLLTAFGGTNGVSLQTFTASLLNGASSFTIQGVVPNGPGNRGIKISNIQVELSEIPLPASSGLLLAAIMGLGFYKRRKP
ncbi:VPLPA-CTERM protein sorting domain-containing protein [Cognatiyoonia sediminum]|uniref:VPLPA-CTERM protein sorting domain-containing protein n=1 Tax=Cognatiyoonia sediminum TaxID=1508389 RepID=A0A1M5LH43_9RHOB|nr:VPLPA-CTERM sorting domain-containing protein [Cognatiyoonia sediminum]SHG64286.1 VPLPA-CTERM protein sorting domain-containing protein [Cognatiyoonia sediminum]